MKGLSAYIYKPQYGDCSNGGLSSKYTNVIIVDETIPEIFSTNETTPAVKLVYRKLSSMNEPYIHAEPVERKRGCGPMFGGCFIYSSDSRFPHNYPIPLHDRFE